MRAILAIVAFFAFTSIATAGQVVGGVSFNFTGTNWSATDCNGDGNAWNCPLNGSDASGKGGKGKGGKK